MTEVHVPTLEDDSFRPLSMTAVGLAAMLAGGALAYWMAPNQGLRPGTNEVVDSAGPGSVSSTAEPTAPMEPGPPSNAAIVALADEPTDEIIETEDLAPTIEEPDTGTETETEAAPAAEPATTNEQTSSFNIVPGRVAYLSCPSGTDHCPRDTQLEQAAWSIIQGLPTCVNPPETAGEADVRIEVRNEGESIVHLRGRARAGVTRLDGPRVLDCLRTPLGALRSTQPRPFVLSLRFAME